MDIKRSEKLNDGVRVDFDNGWYYAHSIKKIGNEVDDFSKYGDLSMWSWINHLRHKRWWNTDLEKKFTKEVSKYFL